VKMITRIRRHWRTLTTYPVISMHVYRVEGAERSERACVAFEVLATLMNEGTTADRPHAPFSYRDVVLTALKTASSSRYPAYCQCAVSQTPTHARALMGVTHGSEMNSACMIALVSVRPSGVGKGKYFTLAILDIRHSPLSDSY
jgi:hypothetical protein